MRLPLYISEYDEKAASRRPIKRASHLGQGVHWDARLPRSWRDLTIGPLWVDVHRDADLGAERWVGYDEEELPCLCRYCFRHVGDERDAERAFAEDLMAWRMRDGRWLIHRIITSPDNGGTSYAFYAFADKMPR